jgi:hypothetical protein
MNRAQFPHHDEPPKVLANKLHSPAPLAIPALGINHCWHRSHPPPKQTCPM